jgi:hypothetical protein
VLGPSIFLFPILRQSLSAIRRHMVPPPQLVNNLSRCD